MDGPAQVCAKLQILSAQLIKKGRPDGTNHPADNDIGHNVA